MWLQPHPPHLPWVYITGSGPCRGIQTFQLHNVFFCFQIAPCPGLVLFPCYLPDCMQLSSLRPEILGEADFKHLSVSSPIVVSTSNNGAPELDPERVDRQQPGLLLSAGAVHVPIRADQGTSVERE